MDTKETIPAPVNWKGLFICAGIYMCAHFFLVLLNLKGNYNPQDLQTVSEHFSQEEIARGYNFFLQGAIPSLLFRLARITVLLGSIWYFILPRIMNCLHLGRRAEWVQTLVSFIIIFSTLLCIKIPFAIIAGYIRLADFNLIRTDFSTWFLRYFSAELLSLIIYAAVFTIFVRVFVWLKRPLLYVPLLFFIIAVSIMNVQQYAINPLYYTSTALKKESLRKSLAKLAVESDLQLSEIYVLNKGAYSGFANAYVTGIGHTKTIYLYDTLLEKYSHEEVISIVAHELGHYTREHVAIGLMLASLGVAVAIPLLHLLASFLFYSDFKILLKKHRYFEALCCVLFVSFISIPVQQSISRSMERSADNFALNKTGNVKSFIKMKKKMAVQNRSYLLPHPLYVWFFHSHPTTIERIRNSKIYLDSR